jgi:hypothetical protein
MRPVTTRPVATLALAAVVGGALVAGCAGAAATPAPTTTPTSTTAAVASPEPSIAPAPSLTPVPGGQSSGPGPVGTLIPTTQTDWGEILDDLPASFPIHPDADVAEVPGEVVSGSFEAPADPDALTAWYTDTFTARGYAVDTGTALEDGSRVMDVAADLPECRIQITFRPADGSTIMTVLVASACATGTG